MLYKSNMMCQSVNKTRTDKRIIQSNGQISCTLIFLPRYRQGQLSKASDIVDYRGVGWPFLCWRRCLMGVSTTPGVAITPGVATTPGVPITFGLSENASCATKSNRNIDRTGTLFILGLEKVNWLAYTFSFMLATWATQAQWYFYGTYLHKSKHPNRLLSRTPTESHLVPPSPDGTSHTSSDLTESGQKYLDCLS